MSYEQIKPSLLELPPRDFAEAVFSQERLAEVNTQIERILTPDFGDTLIKVPPKGERRNWQALVDLSGIVFGKDIIKPEPEDTRKPFKYKVEVTTHEPDGQEKTLVLNARMVGQILQKLIAYAEASQKYQNIPEGNTVIDRVRRAAVRHLEVAVDKYEDAQSSVQTISGETISLKKAVNSVGGPEFPGTVDKASKEQVLHILKALEQHSTTITSEGKQANDELIRTGSEQVVKIIY